MDILDLIETDHRLIAKKFDLIVKVETDRQKNQLIFEEIRWDLELHFQAEEASCYPLFLKVPAFKVLIRKAYDDHEDIRKLLGEVNSLPDSRDATLFQNRLLELKNHVESHVIEEERDFFSLLRQELDASEREKLGEVFSGVKLEFERSVA